MKNESIFYKQPANDWLSALPIGNGRLGAMIHGRVYKEQIQLNEESIWTKRSASRINHDSKKYLNEVRQHLMEGRPREAQFLAELASFGTPHWQSAYQTLGQLTLLSNGQHDAVAKDYLRTLDLITGIVSVEYRIGETNFKREMFASAVDNVIVVRIEKDGPLTLKLGLELTRRYDGQAMPIGPKQLLMVGRAGAYGVSFHARVDANSEGGTVSALGDHLLIEEGNAATILISATTDFDKSDEASVSEEIIRKATSLGYQDLRERHIEEHAPSMKRMTISLGTETHGKTELPTDQRLKDLGVGENDEKLIATYVSFGRYLLYGSSRPGTQPANLQGIWNESFTPAWDSKFTTNINLEMNYWPAEVANLSECHDALFDLIDRARTTGSETARVHYGARGFVVHQNLDIWADSAPLDNVYCGLWPTGGVWLVWHYWQRFEYDLNIDFLRDRAYPAMQEAAEFLLSMAVEDDLGRFLIGPSLSPENAYSDHEGIRIALTMSPSLDSQLAHWLFTKCIAASEILGIDNAFIDSVREALPKLPKPGLGRHGQLLEWMEDYEEIEPGHRHFSHLFGVYPDNQILGNSSLTAGARISLQRRLDAGAGASSWSLAWAACLWARFGEGDLAREMIMRVLRERTSPNLFGTHPPQGTNPLTTFQIDGNLGVVAAVAEMLVQSHNGFIKLLPALPTAWAQGMISGLRVRGGFEVEIVWSNWQLDKAIVLSRAGAVCSIFSKDELGVKSEDGQTVVTECISNVVTFKTSIGQKYIIRRLNMNELTKAT